MTGEIIDVLPHIDDRVAGHSIEEMTGPTEVLMGPGPTDTLRGSNVAFLQGSRY